MLSQAAFLFIYNPFCGIFQAMITPILTTHAIMTWTTGHHTLGSYQWSDSLFHRQVSARVILLALAVFEILRATLNLGMALIKTPTAIVTSAYDALARQPTSVAFGFTEVGRHLQQVTCAVRAVFWNLIGVVFAPDQAWLKPHPCGFLGASLGETVWSYRREIALGTAGALATALLLVSSRRRSPTHWLFDKWPVTLLKDQGVRSMLCPALWILSCVASYRLGVGRKATAPASNTASPAAQPPPPLPLRSPPVVPTPGVTTPDVRRRLSLHETPNETTTDETFVPEAPELHLSELSNDANKGPAATSQQPPVNPNPKLPPLPWKPDEFKTFILKPVTRHGPKPPPRSTPSKRLLQIPGLSRIREHVAPNDGDETPDPEWDVSVT